MRTMWLRISEGFAAAKRRFNWQESYASFWLAGIDDTYTGRLLMPDEEHDIDSLRQEIGNAGMDLMDAFDKDLANMLGTFAKHITLMRQELMQRGFDRSAASQVMTSFFVGVLIND